MGTRRRSRKSVPRLQATAGSGVNSASSRQKPRCRTPARAHTHQNKGRVRTRAHGAGTKSWHELLWVRVMAAARARVRACVRGCVRARVRACVHVHVHLERLRIRRVVVRELAHVVGPHEAVLATADREKETRNLRLRVGACACLRKRECADVSVRDATNSTLRTGVTSGSA
eukprot:6210160-Pleurochrysis_carterae.AAC.2